MVASSYPNLGFDPCPGDLRGYQALAAYAGRSAATLADAARALASAGPQEWRGQAAEAFRAQVGQDVLPLARKAGDWVGKAAAALCTWGMTLAGLHDEDAGNMAPSSPGLLASLRHDAISAYGSAVHGLSEFARDRALLEFISGVAKIVATMAELLALFPPFTAVFGPIAIAAAVAALGADALLAGFHHGSWGSVALDAVAMAPDVGWMRPVSKLAAMYKVSGLAGSMTQAHTLTGLVIGKTVEVAPGMFRMIGDSLKTAAGGVDATARALSRVKDLTALR